eukprot:CAMPEP_0117787206 /NCGR_PEP_ID=MMETSP0948-20121206/6263_1 /TAXON_ID=44440 /ORGANISM="Chattonella subsalsa, Strain CCMP2191" /LENGTH=269 /DNA_ID=CAMNT_0005616303 /DNA_START=1 /DNA_END=810 /DNA_ORIENTATION=+
MKKPMLLSSREAFVSLSMRGHGSSHFISPCPLTMAKFADLTTFQMNLNNDLPFKEFGTLTISSNLDSSSIFLTDNLIQGFRDSVQNYLGGSNGISSLTVFVATLIIISSAVGQVLNAAAKAKINSSSSIPADPSISLPALFVLRTLPIWIKAIICITIDLIGDSSFLLPGVGEVGDVVWGPIAALLLQAMFGSAIVSGATLIKELLPFTDFIPTASLALIAQVFFATTPLGILLGFAPVVVEQQQSKPGEGNDMNSQTQQQTKSNSHSK